MSEKPLPAARPCGTCPYRRDVPSGIWDQTEYEKLPRYDLDAVGQFESGAHKGMFYCHQQDGRICAGWAGCHDMTQVMAVRMASLNGRLTLEQIKILWDYETPTPLFASGQEAHDHGMAEYENPSPQAKKRVTQLIKKIGDAR